jgi:hypothetical protein
MTVISTVLAGMSGVGLGNGRDFENPPVLCNIEDGSITEGANGAERPKLAETVNADEAVNVSVGENSPVETNDPDPVSADGKSASERNVAEGSKEADAVKESEAENPAVCDGAIVSGENTAEAHAADPTASVRLLPSDGDKLPVAMKLSDAEN